MFDRLSERFRDVFQSLRGQSKLTEENMKEPLQKVRKALIEADVSMPAIYSFLDQVKHKALGLKVAKELNAEQQFIKTVHEALLHLLGQEHTPLRMNVAPPAVILLVGLQGSGKTTSTAKLAKYLKEEQGKKIAVVSADIYRPAAILQLQVLAEQIGVHWIASQAAESPEIIVQRALKEAKLETVDVLLVDTAGRMHLDDLLMEEVKTINSIVKPVETLFVVDAMMGKESADIAKAFNDALGITGVILTKMDGDARGGAAMSIKTVTGQSVRFMGQGEKLDALTPYHPDRLASLILGMGDMLTLIEEMEKKVDKDKAERIAKKFEKGQSFDFNDLKDQLEQMIKMGGMQSVLGKLPGLSQLPDHVKQKVNDQELGRMIAIIQSMTPKERSFPNLIMNVGSRKRRIATGAGVGIPEVNKLLKQFDQMDKMMKKFSKLGGMKNMMGKLNQMMGGNGGNPFA